MRRLLVLVLTLCVAGCATTGTVQNLRPGERPALDTDEAGLWMVTEEAEKQLASSGKVVNDAELEAWLHRILCRLAPMHCVDVRIYIVRTPDFNASMAPNGSMQVWTGLLLRAENEDQLAFVLGHEFTHYLERHTLERWRELRATAGSTVFIQIVTAAAGVGYAGAAATLAAYAGVAAFNRDQERAADLGGFRMLEKAGYDPREAGRIWRALIAERDASKDPGKVGFFSTHPSSNERAETLEALVKGSPESQTSSAAKRTAYADKVGNKRMAWFRDELRVRDYGRSQVLLDRLADIGLPQGEVDYLQGELLRLRNRQGDTPLALEAYRKSVAQDGAPAEAWLQIGLLLMRGDDHGAARDALQHYLAMKPDASDRKMVEYYINESE